MAIEKRDIEQATLAIFGLVVPALLGSSLTIFNDGDVRWHLAAGQWIIDHRAVPKVDPFSFTFAGQPWMAFEWGSQLIYASAHRLAGFGGVAAVVTAALIALHVMVVAHARRWVGPAGIALTIILMDIVLIPMILARPHVLGWVLIALWLSILLRARDADRTPPLVAAALMTLWVNVHGSFAIGLVLAAVVSLDACIAAQWRWPVVRGWLTFGLLSAAAAMINPSGIHGFLYPLEVAQLKTLPLIVEWRPSNWGHTPAFFIVLGIAAVLMAWRGVRMRPAMAALLVFLVAMAFLQMRHQAVLAIVAAMLLPRALGGTERAKLFADLKTKRRVAAGVGAALGGLLLYRGVMPLEPAENGANPKAAIAALPAELRSAPGLNDYSFGGPLILEGIRPYIDGRSDMYGDAFFTDYQRILDGDRSAFDRANALYGLKWTMIEPRHSKLVSRLDADASWRRIYADRDAVIHIRR